MLIASVTGRLGTILRLCGLGLITWSVFGSSAAPATSGRGLVVLVAFIPAFVAWLVWTFWSSRQEFMTPDVYVLAVCGALIQSVAPNSAGSAFTFVIAMGAAARCGLLAGLATAALGAAAIGTGAIIYGHDALGVLAYALGFAAVTLGGSNIRQTRMRLEQTELLLAQTQRSHEEQLRSARLEESARIARDIHDVLAHTLAGLVIQLEATDALIAQGNTPESIRERVQRAHGLAREGLQEARRAVGALRGETLPQVEPAAALRALAAEYEDPILLTVTGEEVRMRGRAGEAAVRVLREALTNVRKHSPGAEVDVSVVVGEAQLEVTVQSRVPSTVPPVEDGLAAQRVQGRAFATDLARSGGGYGLQGMRERATELGGTLAAGPSAEGWRVALRLPLDQSPSQT